MTRLPKRLLDLEQECLAFAAAYDKVFESGMEYRDLIDPQEAIEFDQLRLRVIETLEDAFGPGSRRCVEMANRFPVPDADEETGCRNVVRKTFPDALRKCAATIHRYADELDAVKVPRQELQTVPSDIELQFGILEVLAKRAKEHKLTIIGRPISTGYLEEFFGIRFDDRLRVRALQAMESLKAQGLIQPTLSDIADPEGWMSISESGRKALETRALTPLDETLKAIQPNLVELRHGAWAALNSDRVDSLRHAAHSGRELIDQLLKAAAPDEAIKAEAGFKADSSSKNGVTRKMRIKHIMTKRHGGKLSETDLTIIDKACDLALAIDAKLMAISHGRETPSKRDVEDALCAAELALSRLLLGN